jgi:hypothetical protein
MQVNFGENFFSSLKRMINRERWYWKTWDWIRYDFPNFCSNVWRFRKALFSHHWWDHHGMLSFNEIAFDHMADNIYRIGNEVDSSRLKKAKAMKRAAELIRNYNQDSYIEMAEKELGEIVNHPWEFEDVPDMPGYSQLKDLDTPEEKEHNSKVFSRAREIEENEWNELWTIIRGQDYSKFSKESEWDSQFDGSGLRGWWD